MDQRDRAGRFAIGDEGDVALDIELEALAILVVVKILGHAPSLLRHPRVEAICPYSNAEARLHRIAEKRCSD